MTAVNERLININPAEFVVEKPVANRNLEMNVWDEVEVRKFLLTVREAGIQEETFYTLAIET